jgi:hypothetical protein
MSSTLFTFQRATFEQQFRSHFRDAFQDWFGNLARLLHPLGDAHSIRVTQGDGKLDVAVLSGQTVYQCYAPNSPKGDAVAKINADFTGVYAHLGGKLSKWIFVHNHPSGALDKKSYKALNDIVADCNAKGIPMTVEAWGIKELWDALQKSAPHSALKDQFGSPDPISITFACIEELLRHVERSAYTVDTTPVSSPSLRKLEFNDLGPAYQAHVLQGRTVMHKVGDYFAKRASSHPEFGEQLAQRFRERYRHIRDHEMADSNETYEKLRLDAGWTASPNVQRELATQAILAYFFESCDIFENPPSP